MPSLDQPKGMKLLASQNGVRAWPGGFGFAKVGANYGPSLMANGEARARGYNRKVTQRSNLFPIPEWFMSLRRVFEQHVSTHKTCLGTLNFVQMSNADSPIIYRSVVAPGWYGHRGWCKQFLRRVEIKRRKDTARYCPVGRQDYLGWRY